jgi:hypothetical protein
MYICAANCLAVETDPVSLWRRRAIVLPHLFPTIERIIADDTSYVFIFACQL